MISRKPPIGVLVPSNVVMISGPVSQVFFLKFSISVGMGEKVFVS
jgi:hypothetical protein